MAAVEIMRRADNDSIQILHGEQLFTILCSETHSVPILDSCEVVTVDAADGARLGKFREFSKGVIESCRRSYSLN